MPLTHVPLLLPRSSMSTTGSFLLEFSTLHLTCFPLPSPSGTFPFFPFPPSPTSSTASISTSETSSSNLQILQCLLLTLFAAMVRSLYLGEGARPTRS